MEERLNHNMNLISFPTVIIVNRSRL